MIYTKFNAQNTVLTATIVPDKMKLSLQPPAQRRKGKYVASKKKKVTFFWIPGSGGGVLSRSGSDMLLTDGLSISSSSVDDELGGEGGDADRGLGVEPIRFEIIAGSPLTICRRSC